MTAGSISLLKSCIITVSLPNSGVRNSTAIVMCWEWIGTVTELRFQIEVCSMNVVSTEKARVALMSLGCSAMSVALSRGVSGGSDSWETVDPEEHLFAMSQRPTSFDSKAFIFHHTLTEGTRTLRVVGRAQGFIIPLEHFAHSAFNIIYLTFDMSEYSGSLNIQANQVHDKGREELTVVGGMGVFAFTRGLAIFS
ncbi:hypothetical protein IFM89_032661 [Coptis chinensis]|uniref:Dirigent protein n=1 Tax=Coptis chinensis TaxID=261450 RepID=A0A835MAM9_9MAGN|nr:hypothetical protein IFM89_032661 [Coptis chinensis]